MQINRRAPHRLNGFTLVELLVVVAILSILCALSYSAIMRSLMEAKIAVSTSNLRQLASANMAYASDNSGSFCPAQDRYNLVRWHGVRTSTDEAFDPSKGFLTPYLGTDGRIKVDPLFTPTLTGPGSFENGSGGYGYNETYIGGTPADYTVPIKIQMVPNLTQTVMFTTTAFAVGELLQEYPYSESPQWVDSNGNLAGALEPSVHFRANGNALVAWCDGHVTSEPPSKLGDEKHLLGWFGPLENNGYWNPNYGR